MKQMQMQGLGLRRRWAMTWMRMGTLLAVGAMVAMQMTMRATVRVAAKMVVGLEKGRAQCRWRTRIVPPPGRISTAAPPTPLLSRAAAEGNTSHRRDEHSY
jgi:hypothetical protein